MIDPVTRFLILLFLVTTMLAIGLRVTGAEVLAAMKDRSLMARSLLANLVIIPAIGFVLSRVVPLPTDTAVGILLLTAAPGGIGAIQFTSKTPAKSIPFAAGLLFVLSVIAIVSTPMTAKLILPGGSPIVLPYLRVIRFLLLYLLLPMLAGFAIQRLSERAANVLQKPIALVGTLSFVATVILTMGMKKQATRAIGSNGVLVMLVLVLAAMAIGWLFGGPGKGTRRVLATGTSFRNAPLCLLIAVKSFPDTNVAVAVVAFTALMVPPNMLFTVYHTVRNKRSKNRKPAEDTGVQGGRKEIV